MAPGDDCSSKRQGDMRPPQSKTHRHHEPSFEYRKGEHPSMDPVGPMEVPAPRGLDSMMAYIWRQEHRAHLRAALQIGSRWRQKIGERFTCRGACFQRAR
jgi:hypothetical protein